jgi:DNA-binding transcriptional MocR family regulator
MSFSKILAPALRLGALIANPDTLLAASSVKHGTDLVVSSLLQRAVADFLSRGLFEAHLARACPIYRERRDALLAALRDHLEGSIWTEPEGGLSLWVQLPDVVDERVLAHEAIGAGVGIARGEAFFAEPSPHPAMRLSFGQLAPDAIHQGMTILGEIVAGHVQRRRPMFARLGQTEPLV